MKIMGGNEKTTLLKANFANVSIKGKTEKAEIKNVEETPQNKFFARENRLMKGAIVDTSLGRARVTNRPSQEGCVNVVLIEDKNRKA
jgi:small subunit ribosomal protein S8e